MSAGTKHLTVIENTASQAYSALGSTYGAAKDKALDLSPGFMAKVVANIEGIFQPVMNLTQRGASTALLYADSTVDSGLNLASNTAQMSHNTAVKIVGEERMKPVDGLISHAQDAFSNSYETVKDEGVVNAAKKAASSAGTYVNAFASRFWSDYVAPSGKFVKSQYDGVHDTVVKQPLYAAFFNLSTSVGTLVYSLPPVRVPLEFARNRVYPHIEPQVGPYVSSAEKYINKFEGHIQPRTEPPKDPAKRVERHAKSSAKKAEKQAKGAAQQTQQKAANGLPDMPQ